MKVIRQCEANVELDGPEVVRTYLETGKITFGSSTLLPGQTGGIDPGHPQSHEVFFVSRGHVIMRNTNTMKCFELNEGDIILVEEGEPHELTGSYYMELCTKSYKIKTGDMPVLKKIKRDMHCEKSSGKGGIYESAKSWTCRSNLQI